MQKPARNKRLLSLIIPFYKQEQTSVENVWQLKHVLDTLQIDYEIIAVVDGIVDRTLYRLHKANIPKVFCVSYSKNQGKAYALRSGMNVANGDKIMYIDAGMEIDPEGIAILLAYLDFHNADIIVGSKRHPASIIRYPLSRKILSTGYYFLVKILFGISVKDTQAGIKVFKTEVLKKVLPHLKEKKFAGDLEILVVANKMGYSRIYEAPIKLDYSFSTITSAATLRAITVIFFDTIAVFFRQYLTDFFNPRILLSSFISR